MNLAIFASGNGSNAENIVQFFKNDTAVNVQLILTNNSKAFVIERAKKLNIDCFVFDKEQWKNETEILQKLKDSEIVFIILAGFLKKIPLSLIKAYPNKIINIHPALLPKFGGKGMYGDNVHKAVIAANEKESGISVHLVNEHYDEGKILFQAKCAIDEDDTAETLAKKVHQLEYQYFPKAIRDFLQKCSESDI